MNDPALETELAALLRNGRKIDAIKLVRQRHGLGLKEAKDEVDLLERSLGLAPQPVAAGPKSSLIFWFLFVLMGLAVWWFFTRKASAQELTLPSGPLQFGVFHARFGADGTFALDGQGWPSFAGTWKRSADTIEIATPGAAGGCDAAGRYKVHVDSRVTLDVIEDAC